MEPTPICWKRLCLLGLSCAIGIYTWISLACQLCGENRGFPKYSSAAQRFHYEPIPIKEEAKRNVAPTRPVLIPRARRSDECRSPSVSLLQPSLQLHRNHTNGEP